MARPGLVLALVLGCSSPRPTGALRPDPVPVDPVPIRPVFAAAQVAPWSLTASDGSGLALVRVDAKAVVEGPLAFTELHLYFENPEDRVREGRFAIALPARASVSRFAMAIDASDRLQEAEVVDKARARRVYDDFLHRRQDPALLEKSTGNEFTARVFPIPPRATKHLVISFGQELAGEYVLPLRGLPAIAQIDVHVDTIRVDGTRGADELHERAWLPDRDFTTGTAGPEAISADGMVAVQYTPKLVATAGDAPRALSLLVDTSASRALGFAAYLDTIRGLAFALRERYGDVAIQLVAFDQTTEMIYDGSIAGLLADARPWRALHERGAEGASDLGQAVVALALRRHADRIVVVTDGVITAGTDPPRLAAMLGRLAARVDVVLAGGLRDDGAATTLARAGKRPGDVFDLERGTANVAIGLGQRVLADVDIAIPGATWTYPRRLSTVRAGGDPITVYAKLAHTPKAITLATSAGDRRTLPVVPTAPALIRRAIAAAEIAELERGDLERPELRAEIARRSLAARVVSSQTALLVLETEADYQRYAITRTGLADILTIGPGGLTLAHRGDLVLGAGAGPELVIPGGPPPVLGTTVTETSGGFGYGRSGFGPGGGGTGSGSIGLRPADGGPGRYGTIGHGSGSGSGYGVAGGRGGRGRMADVPQVTLSTPTAEGSLDKAIIRRYVRRNLDKIRYCYERELLSRPSLAGTIQVTFSITEGGTVPQASATGFDKTVGDCVADVFRKIEFPRPQVGKVIVRYPLAFRRPDPAPRIAIAPAPEPARAPEPEPPPVPPLTGKLADVTAALARGDTTAALARARSWRAEAPGDLLAIVALGEALEARRDAGAARVYGSIIDLYPARADLRRFAGERLERVAGRDPAARRVALETYRRAVADRPDHISGHRLLAYAQVRAGDLAAAFAAILVANDHVLEGGNAATARMIAEDVAMIAAAYAAAGGPRETIAARLAERSLTMSTSPSTRFVLYWETDANDVDLHVRDARGGHAWYGSRELSSGGELYGDVTTGYGPECFAMSAATAGPYALSVHYYARGPMGFGMGLVEVQHFDGARFSFDDRPFVIMNDHATVELGSWR